MGQATFLFDNHLSALSPGVADAPVYDWTGSLLHGSEWVAELYGGTTSDSLNPVVGHGSLSPVFAPFVKPGYFMGGNYVSVLSVHGSGWAWLQVKVWDVQVEATYEQAVASGQGGYGQSTLFYAQGGDPQALQVPQPLVGMASFSVLQPVPEASTWTLLALGLGGLVCCRRH